MAGCQVPFWHWDCGGTAPREDLKLVLQLALQAPPWGLPEQEEGQVPLVRGAGVPAQAAEETARGERCGRTGEMGKDEKDNKQCS